jgi:hypothetical protein
MDRDIDPAATICHCDQEWICTSASIGRGPIKIA